MNLKDTRTNDNLLWIKSRIFGLTIHNKFTKKLKIQGDQVHMIIIFGKPKLTFAATLCGSLDEAGFLGFDEESLATAVHCFFGNCAL